LTRGHNSTLVAFVLPKNPTISKFKIVATHTDSPCIRIAPKDKLEQCGYLQTNIQLYGGGIWYSWFDRPLVVGGRVVFEQDSKLITKLYLSSKPIAIVSSMCIHLKDSNPLDIDKEKDLKPIFATQLMSQLQA
jgi:aspartyl aminopeptidase